MNRATTVLLCFAASTGLMAILESRVFALQPEIGTIDPRIEIMFAVQILAGYDQTGLISEFDTQYQRAMREHFAPFAEHEAVLLFKKRMYEGFNFAAPLEFMLCHDTVENMKRLHPYSKSLLQKLGNEEAAEKFRSAMADFATSTKALRFFKTQDTTWQTIVSLARKDIELPVLIKRIENYASMPLPQASVIFMPLGHQGGFGLHMTGTTGTSRAIALIGPSKVADEIPLFTGDDSTKLLVLHELAHTIVNPLLEKHELEIERSASAFNPVRERLKSEACGEWSSCVKETVVRALVTRLAEQSLGSRAALAQRVQDRRRGWVYVDEFLPILEKFEQEKPAVPLKEWIPQFVERFDFISKCVDSMQ